MVDPRIKATALNKRIKITALKQQLVSLHKQEVVSLKGLNLITERGGCA